MPEITIPADADFSEILQTMILYLIANRPPQWGETASLLLRALATHTQQELTHD